MNVFACFSIFFAIFFVFAKLKNKKKDLLFGVILQKTMRKVFQFETQKLRDAIKRKERKRTKVFEERKKSFGKAFFNRDAITLTGAT